MSVEPSPPDTTPAPCAVAPRANASASGADEARMSCTVTIARAPVILAKPAPTASATVSSSSSGTTPRMSYALKIFAKSPIAARPPAPQQRVYRLCVNRLTRRGPVQPPRGTKPEPTGNTGQSGGPSPGTAPRAPAKLAEGQRAGSAASAGVRGSSPGDSTTGPGETGRRTASRIRRLGGGPGVVPRDSTTGPGETGEGQRAGSAASPWGYRDPV